MPPKKKSKFGAIKDRNAFKPLMGSRFFPNIGDFEVMIFGTSLLDSGFFDDLPIPPDVPRDTVSYANYISTKLITNEQQIELCIRRFYNEYVKNPNDDELTDIMFCYTRHISYIRKNFPNPVFTIFTYLWFFFKCLKENYKVQFINGYNPNCLIANENLKKFFEIALEFKNEFPEEFESIESQILNILNEAHREINEEGICDQYIDLEKLPNYFMISNGLKIKRKVKQEQTERARQEELQRIAREQEERSRQEQQERFNRQARESLERIARQKREQAQREQQAREQQAREQQAREQARYEARAEQERVARERSRQQARAEFERAERERAQQERAREQQQREQQEQERARQREQQQREEQERNERPRTPEPEQPPRPPPPPPASVWLDQQNLGEYNIYKSKILEAMELVNTQKMSNRPLVGEYRVSIVTLLIEYINEISVKSERLALINKIWPFIRPYYVLVVDYRKVANRFGRRKKMKFLKIKKGF